MSTVQNHPDLGTGPTTDTGRPSAGEDAYSPPRAPWALVMAREVQVRLRDKSFLIGTVLTLALILGSLVVPALLASGDTEYRVAVTDDTAAVVVEQSEEAVASGMSLPGDGETTVVAERVADREAAEQAVLDGDVDLALVGEPGAWQVLSDGDPGMILYPALADTVQAQALEANAAAAGTTLEELTAGTILTTVDLSGDEGAMPEEMLFLLGMVFAFLFYMAALVFGMQIANSVVEEKQSRIVEILAAAIPVRHLLIGKMLGNTLLAVGQMALIVAVGLIGMTFMDLDVALPGLAEAVGWYLPFFLLGFLALACVWAAAGALASRTEDLQSTTMPLTMVLVVFLLAALYLEGTWRTVASFVPVMSTILMPIRILEGGVPWWQPALALVLVAIFSYLTIHLGSRLYKRALLHTSGSLSWGKAFRLRD